MITEIGFDELAAAQEQGGYVVDVRERDEYAGWIDDGRPVETGQ